MGRSWGSCAEAEGEPGDRQQHRAGDALGGELVELADIERGSAAAPSGARPGGASASRTSTVGRLSTAHSTDRVHGPPASQPDRNRRRLVSGRDRAYAGSDDHRDRAPVKDIVSWDDLDALTADLAVQLEGRHFDVLLAIARGGLVPAGMLAYRLGIREILVAAVAAYDDDGNMAPTPHASSTSPRTSGSATGTCSWSMRSGRPATPRCSSRSWCARRAAGPRPRCSTTSPAARAVSERPDVHAVTTDQWVVYPYKAGK